MSESLKRIDESIDALRLSIEHEPPRLTLGHLDILLSQIAEEIRRRDGSPQRVGSVQAISKLIEGKL